MHLYVYMNIYIYIHILNNCIAWLSVSIYSRTLIDNPPYELLQRFHVGGASSACMRNGLALVVGTASHWSTSRTTRVFNF